MAWKMGCENCGTCGGHGTHSEIVKCKPCRGTGIVKGFFGGESICGKCGGDGDLMMEIRCDDCNGSGVKSCKVYVCDNCGREECSCNDSYPWQD